MADNETGGRTPPYGNNETGGRTPPFGDKPNTKNANRSKLIQSRRKAQLKEHKKRLKALSTRSKQKNSFFKGAKNTAIGRTLFLRGKSRATRKKIEAIKETKRNKQFKGQITIENFLGTIVNKSDGKMRESASTYFATVAKGSEASTQEGRAKREELRSLYESVIRVESEYKEKIAPYVGKNPNFNSSNNAQEYAFDVNMARAARITRQEAARIIESKVKEAKQKAQQLKGAGAGSAEVDELDELLKSLKM